MQFLCMFIAAIVFELVAPIEILSARGIQLLHEYICKKEMRQFTIVQL